VCPYYGSRHLVSEADVVVAPYASVLHADSREALGLSLEGAVLVLDEAHNLVGEWGQVQSKG
jgi:chromosome transmission fidelity protein 1